MFSVIIYSVMVGVGIASGIKDGTLFDNSGEFNPYTDDNMR
jgi:hypothetical protein